MRRIFETSTATSWGQLDLSDYGYDARKRGWYRDTTQTDRALVSSPYASFSIGTPMITLSAPLRGQVRGVIAADLKLDKFSDLVQAQRPGEHGTVIIFVLFGVVIAHPDFARLVAVREDASLPPAAAPDRGNPAAGWSAQCCGDGTAATIMKVALATNMDEITCFACRNFLRVTNLAAILCYLRPKAISHRTYAVWKSKE